MARTPTPSEMQERFIVRMPDGLRERIAAAAKRSGRSMNSEIVAVLEERYPAPVASGISELAEMIGLVARDVAGGRLEPHYLVELMEKLKEQTAGQP